MAVKLSELPSMLVERVERTFAGIRVFGLFDRLDGVREGGYFRLSRGAYAWANLGIGDRSLCMVVVTDERDSAVTELRVGERYIWLDDYWQAPLVEAIADEAHVWREFTFESSDATVFREGDVVGWQQVGRDLPSGAVALGTKPDGWDHEHCGLCGHHIDATNPVGYTDDDEQFLCRACYSRYAANHDVSFQVEA